MSSLKIRGKFLILGVIIFISLFLLAWLALKTNKESLTNLNSVVNSFQKAQNIQISYIEDIFTLREIILSLVISPNDEYKASIDKKIAPIIQRLDEKFSHDSLHVKKVWQNYKELLLKTREYSLQNFDEGAFMNTSSVEREQFYFLLDILKNIQAKELDISEKKLRESQISVIYNRYFIIFTILFVGLIMLFLDSLVIKKITKRIEKVETGLINFFEYLTNPAEYKEIIYIEDEGNKDELGLMSNAINKQVTSAKEALDNDYKLIQEATQTVESLKSGIFGKRLTLNAKSKELNELKNVMNEMIENLENKIQEEITQRTDQEKLLMQQSKLAAIGEMIGNIAHQWRQPISEISAILMELETITRYGTLEKQKLLHSIQMSNKITAHMSTTISDFQNFFRPTKKKVKFSVLLACKKAVSIIQASLDNNGINLIFDIQEDNNIYGYPNEFSHAILNILSNAKDALVSRNIKKPQIIVSIKVGKNYTVIKIEDNAKGIQIKDIDTIFEPYFTTKHAKQGTGIGLYMTKMIIETNMQGFVHVKNTSHGALFTIKI